MKDSVLFFLSLPFIAAGIVWQLVVHGFIVGREFMRMYIDE